MPRAIAERAAGSLLSLAILVSLAFVFAHLVPGGPAYSILGLKATPASVEAVNLQLGLDVPVWRQYAVWWGHLLRGDLGYSYLLNRPVRALLGEYVGRTFLLYATGLAGATALALVTGLLHGAFYRRWPGRLLGGVELLFYAMPSFFLGTLLVLVFSARWHWLPASGADDLRLEPPGWIDQMRHLVLPAATVALASFAGLSRYFAQSVREELGRDYARTASARGASATLVLLGHVLRNSLRPLVTLLGLQIPAIFSGSVVVETVFGFPGVGWLLWRSAIGHDYPVLVAIVLVVGVATIFGNLAADLINTATDPRVGYA